MTGSWQRRFVEELASGPYLPPLGTTGAHRILIVAFGHEPDDLARLADDLATLQLHRPELEPVLLIDDVDNGPLAGSAFVYETTMSASELATLGTDLDHRTYRRDRVDDMIALYRPERTIVVAPGGRLDAETVP